MTTRTSEEIDGVDVFTYDTDLLAKAHELRKPELLVLAKSRSYAGLYRLNKAELAVIVADTWTAERDESRKLPEVNEQITATLDEIAPVPAQADASPKFSPEFLRRQRENEAAYAKIPPLPKASDEDLYGPNDHDSDELIERETAAQKAEMSDAEASGSICGGTYRSRHGGPDFGPCARAAGHRRACRGLDGAVFHADENTKASARPNPATWAMSYPLAPGGDGNVMQGHADHCAEFGHATHTEVGRDGTKTVAGFCPRCGDLLATPGVGDTVRHIVGSAAEFTVTKVHPEWKMVMLSDNGNVWVSMAHLRVVRRAPERSKLHVRHYAGSVVYVFEGETASRVYISDLGRGVLYNVSSIDFRDHYVAVCAHGYGQHDTCPSCDAAEEQQPEALVVTPGYVRRIKDARDEAEAKVAELITERDGARRQVKQLRDYAAEIATHRASLIVGHELLTQRLTEACILLTLLADRFELQGQKHVADNAREFADATRRRFLA